MGRRFLRFRLAALLVVVAAICVYLSMHFPRIEEVAELRVAGPPLYVETQAGLIGSHFVLSEALEHLDMSESARSTPTQVEKLASRLKVEANSSTNTIRLRLSGKPYAREETKETLDAVVKAYIKTVVDTEQQETEGKLKELLEKHPKLPRTDDVQSEIDALKTNLGQVSVKLVHPE